MMKKILFISIFVSFISLALAGLSHGDTVASQPNITKVVISASSPIRYKHIQKNNPPRLEITFISRNIFADIEEDVHVNRGLIDYVHAKYYGKKTGAGSAPLKSLTFYLVKKAPYRIVDEENMLVIEIETPVEILVQDTSLGQPVALEITKSETLDTQEKAFLGGIVEGELKIRKEEGPAHGYTDPLEARALGTINEIENVLNSNAPSPLFFEFNQDGQQSDTKIDDQKAPAPMPKLHRKFNVKLVSVAMIFLAIFFAGSYMLWQKRMKDLVRKKIELERPWESVRKNLIAHLDPASSISEAYRSLRTNLLSIAKERPFKSLLITSALPNEGKTTVATNLAVTLANMGSKVLLVDSALRQPLIDRIFDLDIAPGLAEILTKGLYWTEVINSTNVENLSIITSGKLPHNPSEILGSKKMSDLIERFKSQFDIVLFDSHDVIGITDSAVLGSKVDGALLVVRSRKTQRETVLRAQAMLESARVMLLGCVLSVVNTAVPKKFNGIIEYLGPVL